MARHLSEFRPALPADRVPGEAAGGGYFYVGEAARILGLDLDYRQVRALFLLAREQRGASFQDQTEKRWSRFTLEDLATVRVLVELCGGPTALSNGKRLRLRPIRDACMWLHRHGVANPLLEVDLDIQGNRVFASFNGALVETRTGQLALDMHLKLVEAHLGGPRAAGVTLLAAMQSEVVKLKETAEPTQPVRVRRSIGDGVAGPN